MEKKLNKKQRHKIYVNALNQFYNGAVYICHAVSEVSKLDINNLEEFGYELSRLAPENYLEGDASCYTCITADNYNNGIHLSKTHYPRAVRETILEFCIEMTR